MGGDRNDELKIGRRAVLALLLATPTLSLPFSAHAKTKTINPYDERRLLQQNKKIQEANRAPDDFPNFIREGDHVPLSMYVVLPLQRNTRAFRSGIIYVSCPCIYLACLNWFGCHHQNSFGYRLQLNLLDSKLCKLIFHLHKYLWISFSKKYIIDGFICSLLFVPTVYACSFASQMQVSDHQHFTLQSVGVSLFRVSLLIWFLFLSANSATRMTN